MVAEFLKDLEENEFEEQFDLIKQKLEILIDFDLEEYLHEKYSEVIRLVSSIKDIQDVTNFSLMLQIYTRAKEICLEILNAIQNEYPKTNLSEKICEHLEITANLLEVNQNLYQFAVFLERGNNAKGMVEQLKNYNEGFSLLTESVNKFWDIFSPSLRKTMIDYAYLKLDYVANPNFYNRFYDLLDEIRMFWRSIKEGENRNTFVVYRETEISFIKAVFKAQEHSSNKILKLQSYPDYFKQRGRKTEDQIEKNLPLMNWLRARLDNKGKLSEQEIQEGKEKHELLNKMLNEERKEEHGISS